MSPLNRDTLRRLQGKAPLDKQPIQFARPLGGSIESEAIAGQVAGLLHDDLVGQRSTSNRNIDTVD